MADASGFPQFTEYMESVIEVAEKQQIVTRDDFLVACVHLATLVVVSDQALPKFEATQLDHWLETLRRTSRLTQDAISVLASQEPQSPDLHISTEEAKEHLWKISHLADAAVAGIRRYVSQSSEPSSN